MGILDKLLGRGKKKNEDYRPLSSQGDTQSSEQQDATRSRMEAEMQTSKDDRDDRAAGAKE